MAPVAAVDGLLVKVGIGGRTGWIEGCSRGARCSLQSDGGRGRCRTLLLAPMTYPNDIALEGEGVSGWQNLRHLKNCRKSPRWITIEARAKMIKILFFVHFFGLNGL